ncbi:MAG TPA: hypothetical protein VMB03_19775 [Bryobacteraceae bacterium]|nr:hypothetical protein [Bryobacteraceae bacterium]
MRRLLLAVVLLAAPACKRAHVRHVDTVEEPARLASLVRMNDATMAGQLTSGFYSIENGAWRWTMQKFSVTLRPPARSAQQGALLDFHLTIPPPSIEKLGSVTLSASAGGAVLAPETYSKAGEYTYRREIPASALAGDSVRIDFQLDKAIPPGDVDKRELGVVASSIALAAK